MRSPAEVIEENNRQRYLARREAARRRGVTHAGNRTSTNPGGLGRSAGTRLPRRDAVTPWLLIALVGSLGGLFVLAVIGAYAVIRAVFGSV